MTERRRKKYRRRMEGLPLCFRFLKTTRGQVMGVKTQYGAKQLCTDIYTHTHTPSTHTDSQTMHTIANCPVEEAGVKTGTFINPNIHPREYPSLRPKAGNGER